MIFNEAAIPADGDSPDKKKEGEDDSSQWSTTINTTS